MMLQCGKNIPKTWREEELILPGRIEDLPVRGLVDDPC